MQLQVFNLKRSKLLELILKSNLEPNNYSFITAAIMNILSIDIKHQNYY